ncbi:MAG: alpha/beta fold hydrolase [Chloroflexia bacterium]
MPYIKAGDLNIYYIEKGEGRPVVFVHGNWTTSTSWLPVLDRLQDGWRGIAYDLRGRGKTEGPDNDYTMSELAADLGAFVDALTLSRFHLVGHSLGSAIAMQFALDNLDRIESLTIVAPAWVDGMPESLNAPEGQRALKADKTFYGRVLRYMMPTIKDEELFERLVDEGHEQRIEATLRNVSALLGWKPGDRLGSIADAGVPVLVVVGEQDQLTGPTASRAAQVLKASKVIIPGVGHSPNIEAPSEFVRVMFDHIRNT